MKVGRHKGWNAGVLLLDGAKIIMFDRSAERASAFAQEYLELVKSHLSN